MTIYPSRPSKIIIINYCECGHTWGCHQLSWRDYLPFLNQSGKCKTCMCPRYKKIVQTGDKSQ